MSDPTNDRKHQVRRGSLLDHALDAPAVSSTRRAPAQGIENDRVARHDEGKSGRRSAAPSMLSASPRNARLSTSRLTTSANGSEDLPQPEPSSRQIPDQPAVRKKDQEKFGDRIARLIGKVGPDEARPPVQPASPQADPEPAASTQQAPSQSEYGARDFFARQPAPHQDDQIRDDHYHWHAASQDASDNGQRPLLDASILISAVWRYRALIAAFTILGAVLGVLMALSTPHKYYAESRLFVDPREIRVTQDDSRNQQLSTEAMLAITDSQLQILSSTSVLEKVIIDLGLERDPEFNGSLSSGGIGGGMALIKEIFTGKGGPSDAEQKAIEKQIGRAHV